MSVRNFWTVFLKIMGIWLVIGGFTTLAQFMSAFTFLGSNQNENWWTILSVVGLLLLTITMYFVVLWIFVFKTSWLIDKLKLEKGFHEEKIEFNVQTSSILTIATIVIGGLIFIDALPQLCKQVFFFFQQKNQFVESPSSEWVIFYLVKTLVGYLLVTNSKVIVKFLQKQSI
jgi:hypothetical protein